MVVVLHPPPLAVSVKVAVPEYNAGGVQVVVFGVDPVLLAKVPPTPPSDQIAEVAVPLNDPPNAADVPPTQIALSGVPAFANGAVTITFNDLAGPLPQALNGVTVTFPVVFPVVTVMLFVVPPAV